MSGLEKVFEQAVELSGTEKFWNFPDDTGDFSIGILPDDTGNESRLSPRESMVCTDDTGTSYTDENGELLPNTTYQLNGNTYTTDENGRIIICEAAPHPTPDNGRDGDAQKRAGGTDRLPNDHGGHVVSRDLGGDTGIGNIIPLDGRINQSDYRRMENAIAKACLEGKTVTMRCEMVYSGNSKRPDTIIVTVTVDGETTTYFFDNNLDGSLIDEVPENGKNMVLKVLERTGGTISSIIKEYDEDGNLIKTTVIITTTNADGSPRRVPVVIDTPQGGMS